MCTSMTFRTKENEIFLGRTMDFSYDIQPQFYVTPTEFIWMNSANNLAMKDTYRFIGLGQELDGLLVFFDGVNEHGFAAATLYFAGYAQYDTFTASSSTVQIPSFDFLHYILGNCASIMDLERILHNVSIMGVMDPVTHSIAPLHWIATDRSGRCVVIELTDRGLELIENPIGVMTNSPNFEWHLTNLRNYIEASPVQTPTATWDSVVLTPFGQGGGTIPLPGGYTSPERFVRVAYLKSNVPEANDATEAIISCFHILESVTIPKGAILTNKNTFDYTKYTAFINTKTCEYHYKAYDDLEVHTVSLFEQ